MIATWVGMFLFGLGQAEAGVHRFALAVGNNEGKDARSTLVFAEDDARKVREVLVSVGGYQPGDVELLLGEKRNDLLEALARVRTEVAQAAARGDETLFLFYFSGHGDGTRLQLGTTWVTYEELETLLDRTGADVRLAFLDSCQSGAMTRSRTKGGVRTPSFVFDVTERLGTTGQVIITSSSGDEASQESDEIGGSYFTHFLASALVGAADADDDQRVTLGEAYQYVYHETVYRTASTRAGTQHPTYEWDLAGKGDVVLADLTEARATLRFPAGMVGSFAIFDHDRRMFVAEVELDGEPRDFALRPGEYLVQRRYPSYLEVARVDLPEGGWAEVRDGQFSAIEYEDDLAKGAIDRRLERSQLPRLSVRIMAGQRAFTDKTVKASYLPDSPFGGAGARFGWRDGRWIAADLLSGAILADLSFEGLDYTVPILETSTTLGVSAGYATRPARFQTGGGLRIAGAWFRRDFTASDMEGQEIFSVSPGLAGWVGWHPGRLELDLEFHLQYLPYHLDDRLTGLAFTEGFLTFGYRF